jgi:hypothetical protein
MFARMYQVTRKKGSEDVQIFLHTSSGLTLETIDDGTTIAEIVESAGLADAMGWLENDDESLDGDTRVAAVTGDGGHLHIGRCHRVEVTVHFAGRTKAQTFAPSATIGRVRHWALGEEGFDLPQKERPKYEVGICGTGVIADRNDHIGTLAIECDLCLDLAPKDRFQG